MEGLKLVKGFDGCQGCFFENRDDCPAENPIQPLRPDFSVCELEEFDSGIFVPDV